MKVCVQYTAQMRAVAGAIEEHVELPAEGSVAHLLEWLAARWGQEGACHLLEPNGQPLRSLLIVVNDSAVPPSDLATHRLAPNDVVSFYPPIAGG